MYLGRSPVRTDVEATLLFPQLGIETLLFQKRAVFASFDQTPTIQNHNIIHLGDRREPVGDRDHGARPAQPLQRGIDRGFGTGVQRGCRLIENQNRWVANNRARNRNALALPPRSPATRQSPPK